MNNLIYVTPNEVRANKNKLKVFRDAFGNELNIGDKVIFGGCYGNIYKGEIEGFTETKFVLIKYTLKNREEFNHIYKTPYKIYKL